MLNQERQKHNWHDLYSREMLTERTQCGPLSTSPKHSAQLVTMGFGNKWQSLAVHLGA